MVKMQKLRLYQAKMVNFVTGSRRERYFESLRGALAYAKIWQGIPGIRVYVKSAVVELPGVFDSPRSALENSGIWQGIQGMRAYVKIDDSVN